MVTSRLHPYCCYVRVLRLFSTRQTNANCLRVKPSSFSAWWKVIGGKIERTSDGVVEKWNKNAILNLQMKIKLVLLLWRRLRRNEGNTWKKLGQKDFPQLSFEGWISLLNERIEIFQLRAFFHCSACHRLPLINYFLGLLHTWQDIQPDFECQYIEMSTLHWLYRK